ncbi:A/G-specific DNA-adenine glycosylase [Devosia enhydra]|uniref:Adenine DNA glycosylase n=1 Tax=Devosia enhydra TaxID=665118 RepID=A0A1K2I138_9HYPH|nr:A/G-specific adenine glycosylase [Devosia enhydra]SFZ86098.1 A/G-specific DNA-adenine glycosylase [Devosia enhydra]
MPKSPARQIDAAPLDAAAVLQWYDRNARDLPWRVPPADRARGIAPDPYRIWLSEVMLQQTTIAAVRSYYARFTALWPSVADLAAAPLDRVLVEWAGLGYYARARNLHACARAVVERHGGVFPTRSAELLALPGIGAYTAAAIAAITGDEEVAVLDGNVERVLARYLALPVPVREAKEGLRAYLQEQVPQRAGDFAQAMMDLGATICAPRSALCMLCPLQPGCLGTRADPLVYPVKAAKPERPVRFGHAFVIRDRDGDIYLRRRPEKGLLARMAETPTTPWTDEALPVVFPFAADWRALMPITHVFTHFRLELSVWTAEAPVPADLAEGWWAAPEGLDDEALPSLFRKVLASAGL